MSSTLVLWVAGFALMGCLTLAVIAWVGLQRMHHLRTELQARTTRVAELNTRVEALEKIQRDFSDALPIGIFQADLSGATMQRFGFLSRKVEELLGVPLEDILADPVERWRNVPQEDRDLIDAKRNENARANATNPGVIRTLDAEFRVLLPQGQRWLRVYSVNTSGGRAGVQSVCGYFEDITRRISMEKRLKQALDEQTYIFEATSVGVAHVAKNQLVRANKAFSRLLKLDNEQLCGRDIFSVFQVRVPTRDDWQAELLQTIHFGDMYRLDAAIVDAQGNEISVQITANLLDHNQREGGYILTLEDISDRLQTLEEFQRAKVLAEDAARAKSDFLANMSHEIRTPMNAIIGLSGLALTQEMPARLEDYLQKIRSSGEHLLGIINDILDISKIESGKMEMESVPFSLADVIDNVVNLVGQKVEAKGLKLLVQVDPQIPPLLVGDALRIGQVLINLCNNAVKFTEQGEVRIDLRIQESIEDRLCLLLEVSDTGIGLSEAQIGKLFTSFSQADASTTRKYGGTGLGLAISKSLAEAMGGRIGVRSEIGQGATFWFTVQLRICANEDVLPAHPSADAASQRSYAQALQALAGARLLLVEDNEINQQVACELLGMAGFSVDVADNGQVAVMQVQTHHSEGVPYDLVLMDMQMPVMDGVTATRVLRESYSAQDLPIVAMTANAMKIDRDRCLDAGMNSVVTKPINPDHLWQALAQWIRPRPGLGGASEPAAAAASGVQAHTAAAQPTAAQVQAQQIVQDLHGLGLLQLDAALLRLRNNRTLFVSILRNFMDSQSRACEGVAHCLAQGDSPGAERIAHTLKGLAASLGASALLQRADVLETALRDGAEAAHTHAALQGCTQALEELLAALQSVPGLVEQQVAATVGPLEPQQLAHAHALREQLRSLLRDADASALGLWSQHAALLNAFFAKPEEMEEAMAQFDFERVLELLDQPRSAQPSGI